MKIILSQLPFDDLRKVAAALLDRGVSVGDVIDQVAELADKLVDWRKQIKGPAGVAAEAADGPLLRLVISAIVSAARAGKAS